MSHYFTLGLVLNLCIWLKKIMKKLINVFLIAIFFSSCATIFTGSRTNIRFDSEPPKAMVYINGVDQSRTPCTANLKTKGGVKLAEFRMKGYETSTVMLEKSFNSVSILNLSNVLGWIIDASTGAIQKFDQKTYNIQLEEK